MRKIILICALALLIIPSVFAALSDQITHVWTFDSVGAYGSQRSVSDSVGTSYMTLESSIWPSNTCKDGTCIYTDGNGGENTQDIRPNASFCSEMTGAYNFTMVMWIKSEVSGVERLYDIGAFDMYIDPVSFYSFTFSTTEGDIVKNDNTTWAMLTLIHNQTANGGWYLYNNTGRVDFDIGVATVGTDCTSAKSAFLLGSGWAGDYFSGSLDEMAIWNRTLTPTELTTLWNSGSGTFYPFGGSSGTVTISITYPTASDILPYNTNVYLNLTTDIPSNCTINQTNFTTYNHINTTNHNFLAPYMPDGSYSVNVQCVNQSNPAYNGTASRTFEIDTTYPTIISGFSGGNIVQFWNKEVNVSSYVNASDTNLYSVLINDSYTGVIVNATSITGSTYNFTVSLNSSKYPAGKNYLSVKVADGHTGEAIGDWAITKNVVSKEIVYNTDKGSFSIAPETVSVLDSFDTQKLQDRYTFEYSPFVKGESQISFIVEAEGRIDIITKEGKTNYNAWLVIPSQDKWIDFNLKNGDGKETYKVERLRDNSVRVVITGLNPEMKEYLFESTGDLNIYTATYEWYNINASEGGYTTLYENSTRTFYLNLTRENNNITTLAGLWFNGTKYTPTKATSLGVDMYNVSVTSDAVASPALNYSYTYQWRYNATTSVDFENTSNSISGYVYAFYLKECGGSVSTQALNYTVSSIVTGAAVSNYLFAGAYNYFVADNTNYKKFIGFNNISNTTNGLCIYPPTGDIMANYISVFSATSYEPSTYQANNAHFNSTYQSVNIYLQDTASASTRSVLLTNENNYALIGYTVEIWKWDIPTNTYKLISVETTDANGRADFSVDTDFEYKFIVKNLAGTEQTTIPDCTQKQKLLSSSYSYIISLGTSPESISLKLSTLGIDLSKNQNGKNFTLNWTNIGNMVSMINLTVTKGNFTNSTLIYIINSTSSSGILNFTISDTTTNIDISYIADVYVLAIEDGNWYFSQEERLDFNKAWAIFGTESVVVSLLFIGTLMFAGIAISPVIALVGAGLGVFAAIALGWLMLGMTSLGAIIVLAVFLIVRSRQ